MASTHFVVVAASKWGLTYHVPIRAVLMGDGLALKRCWLEPHGTAPPLDNWARSDLDSSGGVGVRCCVWVRDDGYGPSYLCACFGYATMAAGLATLCLFWAVGMRGGE